MFINAVTGNRHVALINGTYSGVFGLCLQLAIKVVWGHATCHCLTVKTEVGKLDSVSPDLSVSCQQP